jgi:hypothetical protein
MSLSVRTRTRPETQESYGFCPTEDLRLVHGIVEWYFYSLGTTSWGAADHRCCKERSVRIIPQETLTHCVSVIRTRSSLRNHDDCCILRIIHLPYFLVGPLFEDLDSFKVIVALFICDFFTARPFRVSNVNAYVCEYTRHTTSLCEQDYHIAVC